ncbi:MAG: 50S ribosomal protein L10 [Deltaproteobacteria bacterium]|nr:50S ribosomal protein L10 [Deltaproteobacteria bacterium]
MNRTEKAAEIESLKARFANAQLTILTDYKGLSVADLTDLRGKLHEVDSSFKVVKNRLAKIALKDSDLEGIAEHFVGTTAVTTTSGDPTGPAKVISNFAKEHDALKIKVGCLDGKTLEVKDLKALADLPSREELVAKMLGSLNAPATNLVSVLVQIPRQLVTVLGAIKDQKEQSA